MTDLICELAGVSKLYNGREVIANVGFDVSRGEMVAVTGRSGSGKSTLLNIIGLLEAADRGVVRLFGKRSPPVQSAEATRILRTGLGYLFQNFALVDGDSVENNLKVAQAFVNEERSIKRGRRQAALEAVGMAGSDRRKVYELSGGEQQRIAIARLMLKPCDLVLADEPTGSLDSANARIVLEMLAKMNAGGKTVIVVTHDDRVAAMCHRSFALPHPEGVIH